MEKDIEKGNVENLGGKREGSGRKSLASKGIHRNTYRIYLTDDENKKVKEFVKKSRGEISNIK